MSGNKILTQEELKYLADHLSEISEDGLELSDNSEDDQVFMTFQDLPLTNDIDGDLFDLESTPIVLLPALEQIQYVSEAEDSQKVRKEIATTNIITSDKEENKKDSALTKIVSHFTNEEDKENQEPKPLQEINTQKRKAIDTDTDTDNSKRKRTDDKIRKERIKKELGKLQWREGHLEMREDAITFRGTEILPTFFHDLKNPLNFFRYFFDNKLVKIIVEQSNLFSMQNTPNSPTTLTESDVKRYVGICVLMSVIHLPSIRRSLPKHMVKRYDKKENKKVDIECPHLVKEYNRHMGGVDLFDSLIGRYRIKLKSRKWYFRLFYHSLDVTVVNSWLLYKKVNAEKSNTKTIKLADFRTELGESLCLTGVRQISERGRKSHRKTTRGETTFTKFGTW